MSQGTKKKSHRGAWITSGVIVVLLVAMGTLGTKVINENDVAAATASGLDPQTFVTESYDDVIVAGITERAEDVVTVAEALQADPAQAAKDFAVGSGPTATYSVKLTGIAGELAPSGYLPITVEGMPEGVGVSVQTGPALLGTALRDATGKATFEMFTNQLDFQGVGDKLNAQMKTELLDKLDIKSLSGQEITVVGAFQPLNPKLLLVMPVSIEVAK